MDVIIGLGSNQEYREMKPFEILNNAKKKMEKRKIVLGTQSKVYISHPFSDKGGPNYSNSVLIATFAGKPHELLFELQQIEYELGRVRHERWGNRSCDLDILAIDDLILPNINEFNHWVSIGLNEQIKISPTELIVPHPRIQDRGFVLKPLVSIFPNWRHPVFKKTASDLFNSLPGDQKVFDIELT